MEIIFELVIELVLQVAGELLVEAGFRGVGRVLSNRVVRTVLGLSLAIGGGFWFGRWWGDRQSAPGDTDLPSSLWVSLVLAVVFGGLALWKWLRTRGQDVVPFHAENGLERVVHAANPLEWSAFRFLTFALLNASIAWGIAAGYTPMPRLR